MDELHSCKSILPALDLLDDGAMRPKDPEPCPWMLCTALTQSLATRNVWRSRSLAKATPPP
jgi:hypothetical protein